MTTHVEDTFIAYAKEACHNASSLLLKDSMPEMSNEERTTAVSTGSDMKAISFEGVDVGNAADSNTTAELVELASVPTASGSLPANFCDVAFATEEVSVIFSSVVVVLIDMVVIARVAVGVVDHLDVV